MPIALYLSVKYEVEFLAHIASLKRFTKAPNPRVENEVCHHEANEQTVDRAGIR